MSTVSPKRLLFSVGIDECRVDALASTSGAGGQNRNRRHTAIRVTHPPSGAVGYSADERSQLQNKVAAFTRMAESPAFKTWHRVETARRRGEKSVEELVEESLRSDLLRFEVQNERQQWVQKYDGDWADE